MKDQDPDIIKLGHFLIDPWLLGWNAPEHNGVDANIYMSGSRQFNSIPFIIITPPNLKIDSIEQNGVIISIGKKPKILWPKSKTIEPKLWQQLLLWIRVNRQGLELLWYEKIGFLTFYKEFYTKV